MGIGACSDDAVETASELQPPESAVIALSDKPRLEVGEAVLPEHWLASREAAADLPTDAPQVVLIDGVLNRATERFGESPRMIANRAVQLETMLLGRGVTERAPTLIEHLTQVVGESGQTEGFGAICQHYFNLRSAGADHAGALGDLKRRYGARS